MRVLITNVILTSRSGTEMYVRDLAKELLARGHSPVVYSPQLGPVAEELERATVPVVDNLVLLGEAPDVIHGHHSLETMAAVAHFPGVPAVFVCHDWAAWHDTPPRHPRIRRYVAVDYTCRDRLLCRHAIAAEKVDVLHNAVDLRRFPARGPLPQRPRRALLFSNYVADGPQLLAVRQACAELGITLDTVGLKLGGGTASPETILGNYDLIFAKARCAWEALATGAAVVVCDAGGIGQLVTTDQLDHLRRCNFGRRLLQTPVRADVVKRQILRYDPVDAAEVSRQIRQTASLDLLVDQLTNLYERVRAEPVDGSVAGLAAEQQATAEYLAWWSTNWLPLLREEGRHFRHRSRIHRLGRSLAKRLRRLPHAVRALARRAAVSPRAVAKNFSSAPRP